MKSSGSTIFSGEAAFKLHDTYGFPVDLTELMARELNYGVDTAKFDELMAEQKDRARTAREEVEHKIEGDFEKDYNVNYDPYSVSDSEINTKVLDVIKDNDVNVIVLENNPFTLKQADR